MWDCRKSESPKWKWQWTVKHVQQVSFLYHCLASVFLIVTPFWHTHTPPNQHTHVHTLLKLPQSRTNLAPSNLPQLSQNHSDTGAHVNTETLHMNRSIYVGALLNVELCTHRWMFQYAPPQHTDNCHKSLWQFGNTGQTTSTAENRTRGMLGIFLFLNSVTSTHKHTDPTKRAHRRTSTHTHKPNALSYRQII